MRRQRFPMLAAAALLASLALAGCGDDKAATARQAQVGEDGLPKPDSVSGSVTGMPDPGSPAARPGPLERPDVDDDPIEANGEVDQVPFDPAAPLPPPNPEGEIAVPPPESMPTMPPPTPDPVEFRVAPPTDG